MIIGASGGTLEKAAVASIPVFSTALACCRFAIRAKHTGSAPIRRAADGDISTGVHKLRAGLCHQHVARDFPEHVFSHTAQQDVWQSCTPSTANSYEVGT